MHCCVHTYTQHGGEIDTWYLAYTCIKRKVYTVQQSSRTWGDSRLSLMTFRVSRIVQPKKTRGPPPVESQKQKHTQPKQKPEAYDDQRRKIITYTCWPYYALLLYLHQQETQIEEACRAARDSHRRHRFRAHQRVCYRSSTYVQQSAGVTPVVCYCISTLLRGGMANRTTYY